MFDFIEKIRKELAVIRGAPWSVAIIAAVVAAVVWFFAGQIYGSAVSAKDATIETLKTQNDSYKEKLSGATPEEAKKRIDDLEARLARVEPRRLTDDQRRIISNSIGALGVGHWIAIQSDMSCGDCNQYAVDFQKTLSDLRWQMIMPKVMAAARASTKGIAILTPDPTNPLPEAAMLAHALSEAKIPFDLGAGADQWPPGERMIAAMLITAKSSF